MMEIGNMMMNSVSKVYDDIYHLGISICSKAVELFGDSKYTHEFLEWVRDTEILGDGLTFDEIVEKYQKMF